MTTDDTNQGNLSDLPVPQDGEQPQDALRARPQSGEPELDAYGVPVQDRPAPGWIYLGVTASFICGVIAAGLSIMALKYHSVRNVPGWLVWVEGAASLLAWLLAVATVVFGEREKVNFKEKVGVAGRSMWIAGIWLGIVGFLIWLRLIGAPLGYG